MAFDGTLKFDTKIDQSGFEGGLSKIGSIAQKGMAAVAGAVTAAAGAMAAIGMKALEAYADYEQLTGGVATLFGAQDMSLEQYAKSIGKSTNAAKAQYDKLLAAQSAVFSNASKSFKTAGLSQNEYMETVTSFSAALIASLKGDTEKAARVADMAITDMSDNANKMGSSMESIQNAYQGFAKQNYTMLDNLKLGYGGTKSEMERLLADAQAISGVKYNLDSYADVVDAIHVIQTEMHISGITAEEAAEAVRNGTMTEAEAFAAMGTTAKEAQSTIQGSLAMTKAAWQNLLVGIADDSADFDTLIDDLVESATAAGENLIPRAEQIIKGLGRAVEILLPTVVETVPQIIMDVVPGLISAAGAAAQTIFDTLIGYIPQATAFATDLMLELVNGMIAALPLVTGAAVDIISTLAFGLADALPSLIPNAVDAIITAILSLTDPANISLLMDGAIALIMGLADGLIAAMPIMIENVPIIIQNLVDAIVENAPMLLDAALELILALAEGLITNLPAILDAQGEILAAILGGLWDFTGTVLAWLGELCGNILSAIGSWFGNLISNVISFTANVASSILSFMNDLPNKIGFALGYVLGSIAKFGANVVSWVTTNVPKIITGAVNFVAQLPGKIWNHLVGTIAKITQFGSQMREKATSSAKGFVTNLVNGLVSLPGKMAEIGGNVVKGLWNGIKNVTKWLTDKVKGFGNSVLNGIKKALGIASPSKVTKGYGKFLAQGLGIGFAAEMPQIGKEAARLLNAMKLPRPKLGFDFDDGDADGRPFSPVRVDRAAVAALTTMPAGLFGGILAPSPTNDVVNSSVANTYANTNNTYHQTLTFNQPIQTPSQIARAARKALEVT